MRPYPVLLHMLNAVGFPKLQYDVSEKLKGWNCISDIRSRLLCCFQLVLKFLSSDCPVLMPVSKCAGMTVTHPKPRRLPPPLHRCSKWTQQSQFLDILHDIVRHVLRYVSDQGEDSHCGKLSDVLNASQRN